MVSIGLSTLYLQIFGEPFLKVVEEIKSPRDASHTPHIWEVVDSGEHTLHRDKIDLLSTLSSEGYKFTVHAPYEEPVNIADPESERRRQALLMLKASVDAAASIEAKVWVFHPGFGRRGEADIRMIQILNQESILTLYEYAKAAGVEPAVENVTPGGSRLMSKPSDFEDFFEVTGLRLPMVFDVGHAHLAGLSKEFITKLSNHFLIIHVHDNRGGFDEHLNMGEGVIDWRDITSQLKDRGFNGIYTVEAAKRPFESISYLRNLLT